jgi:serine/threonine protein phosphatase PrpC
MKNEANISGSTAVIIFIYNNIIYSANIGDSRALLGYLE